MPGRAVPHEAGATVEEERRRRDVLATFEAEEAEAVLRASRRRP